MKLNKTKISSVSTTSLCSEKESCSFDSNPSTMLLPNPTTTATFRSFIKTKSGIMIRKDHHSDEDDEEVAKLCEDSECSKISTDILSDTTTPTNITVSLANNNNNNNSNKKKMEDIQENSNRSILAEFSKDSSNLVPDGLDQPVSTADHQRFMTRFNSIDADQRHSFTSTDTFQSSSSPNGSNSISNTSFVATNINDGTGNNGNDGPKPVGTNVSSSSSSSSSKHHRNHHRTNPILPILKPNRFVKNQSKGSGNLLFNHGNKNQKTKKRSNSESSTSYMHTTTSQDLVKSLRSDRMIATKPDEDRRRRTIIIEKQKNSFGFTLQTYGIKQNQEIELITYVDEVTYGGPAFRGGMRPGDVILSINGRDMEKADHPTLVNYINSCEKTMRLVVLFEDCVRKIELHLKFIKLQKALQQKLTQLEILNQREDQILLNAALRGCCSLPDQPNEITTDDRIASNLDKDEEFVSPINKQKQIRQKCKSLDVSLNDLNCDIEDGSNYHSATFQRNSHANYLATTAATITVSANNVTQSQLNQNEENEILINQTDDEDEVIPKSHPTIDPQQQQPPEQLNYRSISLPQSVANSLDCLTNEAYEDDENLLQSPPPPPPQSLANIQAKSNTSILSISDKDFITKL